ncbi:MAG: GHMP kinase [Gammaproteobacteria bacterium]|nr:GHMP kinase [Gammaproteobacteria bacterium]MDH3559444.1 GHMP kinase [Gammaproteobacteria bacterium]
MNCKYFKGAAFESVRVEAPARLHLGFLDLNGNLGRCFGSLGLTIEEIATEVEISAAEKLQVEGPASARVRVLSCAASLIEQLGLPPGAAIRIKRVIPDHVGLGSGTQLSLAVAAAMSTLYGLDLGIRQMAGLLNRGMRSGIGIGAFDTGGFLVDGGCGERDEPPPVIMQCDFPEAWRLLLIFDQRGPGIHGAQEVSAFQTLPPFPAQDAADLCRLVLMQVLPALAEGDCERFGQGIGRLQEVVGDHFAPAQSGRFASPEVAEVLAWLKAQEISGIGQSSWGPTGFAILDSEVRARHLLHAVQLRYADRPNLSFAVIRARNHGSRIRTRKKEHRALPGALRYKSLVTESFQ